MLRAQVIDGEQRTAVLKAANAKYYSLDKAGVLSFTCNVEPNWETLRWDKMTAPTLEDPLHYATVIAKLKKAPAASFTFTLNKPNHDSSEVTIPDAPGVTADEKDAADTVQGVFGQMLTGYLKFWQEFFNSDMVHGDIKDVKKTATGYAIHESFGDEETNPDLKSLTAGSHTDYELDGNMMLISRTITIPAAEIRMNPAFTASADGALMTSADFTVSNAASAKAGVKNVVSYKTAFAQVDGVMLPTGFESAENVSANGKTGKLEVDVIFSGCTVKKK